MPTTARLAALLPGFALTCLGTACHLVDQRDFDATAGRPPALPHIAGPPQAAAPALVTIRYTVPAPSFREALTGVVQRALARKPDVLFTVTTLVPGQAGPNPQAMDAQVDAAAEAAGSGRDVAQAIVDAGAASGQVEQVVRVEPGLPVREVRVTVH